MTDETTIITKPSGPQQTESSLFGVSVRAWIVILLTIAVGSMSLLEKEVREPLYSGFLVALGYYFSQKNQQAQQTQSTTTTTKT